MSRDHIEDLVHCYADAVVHRDGQQRAATWAPDAVWDLGGGRRVEGRDAIVELWHRSIWETGGLRTDVSRRDAIVELWHRSMARYWAVAQAALNATVTLDIGAGTGSGRWYGQQTARRTGGETAIMLAHYDDTCVRIDGGWRFASRTLTIHYRGSPDLSGAFRTEGGD